MFKLFMLLCRLLLASEGERHEERHRNLSAALCGDRRSVCTRSGCPDTGRQSAFLSRLGRWACVRDPLLSPRTTATTPGTGARARSKAHAAERRICAIRCRCGGAKGPAADLGAPRPEFKCVPATLPDDRSRRLPAGSVDLRLNKICSKAYRRYRSPRTTGRSLELGPRFCADDGSI